MKRWPYEMPIERGALRTLFWITKHNMPEENLYHEALKRALSTYGARAQAVEKTVGKELLHPVI